MARHLWLLVSGCLWAVMMFLLFQREIRPYFEYQAPPSYRQVLTGMRRPEVQKRAVFFGTQRIGDAETLTTPLEAGGARIVSRFLMRVKPFYPDMPIPDDAVYLASEMRLDDSYQLAECRLNGRWQVLRFQGRADRQGERLRVSFAAPPLFKSERLVEFPRDATLSDNFLPYQGGVKLKQGRKWKMKILDVNSLFSASKKEGLSPTEFFAAVTGRDTVTIKNREISCSIVEIRREPNDERWVYLLWVDDEGTVLKQQMKENKLLCEIVLEERKTLSAEEARDYEWSVQPPK